MAGAHRVAYVVHHGLTLADIVGQVVRHTCDNPPCCNPAHLVLGSHADNAADRQERQRGAYQRNREHRPNTVLSAEQVQWVRDNYVARHPVYGQAAMARRLGVSQATLSLTLNNKRNITR